jgi:hypothetical protein
MEKALTLEIDNITERNDVIVSDPFSSGGCEWFLKVDSTVYCGTNHLSVFLHAVEPKPLRTGWIRRANFCFVGLNQYGEELCRASCNSPEERTFSAETTNWGSSTVPLREKGKLTIEVHIKVLEVVHQGKSTANDILVIDGFKIFYSQVNLVNKIFEEHPDFAVDIIPKNQEVKTAYMNLLLRLDNTLRKSPQNLSVTDLTNAQTQLTELTEAGFKLDWLKSKLEEVFLERKKALSDGSWIQQLEERVKNTELTLSDLKAELDKEKIKSAAAAKVSSFSIQTKVSSFQFIDYLMKRFFLSCFSIS